MMGNEMYATMPSVPYTIIHLPANSGEWAGLLAQFTLQIAAAEGRTSAAWASERFTRAMAKNDGVVALANGRLRGVLFFQAVDRTIELTFPWVHPPNEALACELAAAALRVIRDTYPDADDLRAERQLMLGTPRHHSLEAVGFDCYWRRRLLLELNTWSAPLSVPTGYRLAHWNIRELDAAARVVYRANAGTLDARLYASFFGTSPCECRTGLLAILAGSYGPLHHQATLCALHGDRLVGVNLVIGEGAKPATIIEISVDPDHQRRGVARALMVQSLTILKQDWVETVDLAVTVGNPALELYESLGFSPYGDFPVCIWLRGNVESLR